MKQFLKKNEQFFSNFKPVTKRRKEACGREDKNSSPLFPCSPRWERSGTASQVKPRVSTPPNKSSTPSHRLPLAYRVTLRELPSAGLADGPHRLGEVAVHGGVVEVQLLRHVVAQHPWEHRVLSEVVEGPAGQRVEGHEVREVRAPGGILLLRAGGEGACVTRPKERLVERRRRVCRPYPLV